MLRGKRIESKAARPPLQALLIAPDPKVRNDILRGVKNISIREGHRDYRIDSPVMICCHLDPWCAQADVVSVRHCTLEEVTPEEFRADGYRSKEEMLESLRSFYPNLGWDSPVTVICWKNVRGKLADKYHDNH